MRGGPRWSAVVGILLLAGVAQAAGDGIGRIEAGERCLTVHLTRHPRAGSHVLELPAGAPLHAGNTRLWFGRARRETDVPRFDGVRDRLFSTFVLVDERGRVTGVPHFVDDLSRLPARDFPLPWPKSIKGLQVQMVDDAIALGVKYAGYNVGIPQIVDLSGNTPQATWAVDGYEIPINMAYIHGLDETIRGLSDAGINVTVILNNMLPLQRDPKNPLIHPHTDVEGAPFHLGAINVSTEEGIRYYRAAIEFMADRYSRPDAAYGWITGYIVGNEVQSHSVWYNIGRTRLEDFVPDYGLALRITDLCLRKTHRGLRAYASLDHSWTTTIFADPRLAFAGKDFLEQLTEWSRAGGDFPWHVAFHPYPEDLFEPRAWQDILAEWNFETPKITFKNIEVLPAFLRQESMLYNGEPRRIILSEQGFHTPQTPDGEDIQAAAYAWAYYRISRTPGIDAFILHRHVDHQQEFGLWLGLWTRKEEGGPCDPDRRKRIYEVFRAADTPEWEAAFAFAEPIVGISDWREADPVTRIRASRPRDAGLVADLYREAYRAEVTNCPSFRQTKAKVGNGLAGVLFQHPPEQGESSATYRLRLPEASEGERLVLQLSTAIAAESTDGVRFRILADDAVVLDHEQAGQASEAHDIDLTAYAGRRIELSLRTSKRESSAYDWAHWVQPRVVRARP